jgi:hypothetical protein
MVRLVQIAQLCDLGMNWPQDSAEFRMALANIQYGFA